MPGTTPIKKKFFSAFENLVPEIDHAGKSGQPVIERDADRGRRNRIREHVVVGR